MRTKLNIFWDNIKFKLPVFLFLAISIWYLAGYVGFPVWWKIEFVSFAFIGFLIFVLMDLPPLKPEQGTRHSTIRLLGTYALPSILFITVTSQLPQFDPKYELRVIDKPPINIINIPAPELIKEGRNVFQSNKCFNCHKVFWEGNSDRGPNLGTKQIGLYPENYIKEQIIDPRKKQSPGFEDPKSKKAMPTYYEEEIEENEMTALIAYLKSLRDPTHIPVEGKLGNQWTWWDDPQIIMEGKIVFEGKEPATEGLNCAVCHGANGIPMMTGAFDFRDPNGPDTDKMPDHMDKVLKDWPDELYYRRVTRGIDGTAMGPWGTMFPHLYLWKAEAYARTFHDPLGKRKTKKPIPPIPTKEDIAKWKNEGLFLEPLL